MLFVKRELERIQGVLTSEEKPENYDELYAVQQALLWVLDQDAVKSPYDMLVMGTYPSHSAVSQRATLLRDRQ